MADDVAAVQPHEGDVVDALEHVGHGNQPRSLVARQVDLGDVAICSRVVFWASSRMMKLSLRVRPRMKASGATSIWPRSKAASTRSASSMS
jgi:hypothetical protein